MNLRTLLLFLIGHRQAIIDVATSRWALLLGGLFVLSAGFAREYDGEDLRAEPWHLLLPLGASLATSLVLFLLLYGACRMRSESPPEMGRSYGRFLTLYWMTAPLAWIYAIPVEQHLSPADGIRANLTMLAIVSLWRVLLITRCASVLFGSRFAETLMVVMLFADTLALVIVSFTPVPILNVMGGIRLTESEAVILDATLTIKLFGYGSWLIWAIGTLVTYLKQEPKWIPLAVEPHQRGPVSKSLWGLAAVSLLVWIFILPYTQPPVALRHQVDRHLKSGRLEKAMQVMSAHARDDFPRQWDPPPRPAVQDNTPPLPLALRATLDESTAPWVRKLYFDKLARLLDQGPYMSSYFWTSLGDEEFYEYMQLLREAPEMQEMIRADPRPLRDAIGHRAYPHGEPDQQRDDAIRSALEFLGIHSPQQDDTADSDTELSESTDATATSPDATREASPAPDGEDPPSTE